MVVIIHKRIGAGGNTGVKCIDEAQRPALHLPCGWGKVPALIARAGTDLSMAPIEAPIAPGELIDRITILEIKSEKLGNPQAVSNVCRELALLNAARDRQLPASAQLTGLTAALKKINETLWAIEEDIRNCERERDFGARFVELARSVYLNNDERALLKKKINLLLNSELMEEKSYGDHNR